MTHGKDDLGDGRARVVESDEHDAWEADRCGRAYAIGSASSGSSRADAPDQEADHGASEGATRAADEGHGRVTDVPSKSQLRHDEHLSQGNESAAGWHRDR